VATIVGTIAFMLSISVPVALVVILLTPLSVLAAGIIARKSAASFAAQQALQGELGGFAEEVIGNQKLVTAFAHAPADVATFGRVNARLYEKGVHAQFISSLSNPSTRLVNNITYAAVAIAGCASVISGWPTPLTVGQVQSFLSYANQYMKPFNEISAVVTQVQTAFASARRLLRAHGRRGGGSPTPQPRRRFRRCVASSSWTTCASRTRRTTRFCRTCAYTCLPASALRWWAPRLRQDDAHQFAAALLRRGQAAPSRSTGRTRAASRGRACAPRSAWCCKRRGCSRARCATTSPTACQTPRTMRSWLPRRRAHAHKFIMQLPQGYQTLVGEGGGALSQGQRQLLCIARVMMCDPAVLLLDEATSSIDTRTELQVQDAFDRMMEGRTSLVVAHRLSTVRNADCIIVMRDGRVVEKGTHDELLAAGGFYRDLYQSQFAR
jgi:ATP-binding cassette subfamily B protein